MGLARRRRGARDERRRWQVGLRFEELTWVERGVDAGARDGPLGSSASGEGRAGMRCWWAAGEGGEWVAAVAGRAGHLRRARAV